MTLARAIAACAFFALAACGERVAADGNDLAPDLERTASPIPAPATPVRVGEAGQSFAACQGAGTTRNLDAAAGAALPVRAAPFDTAATTGRIAAETRFFVCTRSIDQRWLGIVYEDGGTLSPACGVSAPAPGRGNYAGPCRSGWVASASVRLVAG